MSDAPTNLTPVGREQGFWKYYPDGWALQAIGNRLDRGSSFLIHHGDAEMRRGDAFDGPVDPEGPHYHKLQGKAIRVERKPGETALKATIRTVITDDPEMVRTSAGLTAPVKWRTTP